LFFRQQQKKEISWKQLGGEAFEYRRRCGTNRILNDTKTLFLQKKRLKWASISAKMSV